MDTTTTESQLHICGRWSFLRLYVIEKFTFFFFLSTASIQLSSLPWNISRQDIECPGDLLPFVCSVMSNSETVQLEWFVTFPEQDSTVTILYTNGSTPNVVTLLNMSITTELTEFRLDEFIQSLLVITILQNVPMNGTHLQCASENLASQSQIVYINTSGKCFYR